MRSTGGPPPSVLRSPTSSQPFGVVLVSNFVPSLFPTYVAFMPSSVIGYDDFVIVTLKPWSPSATTVTVGRSPVGEPPRPPGPGSTLSTTCDVLLLGARYSI